MVIAININGISTAVPGTYATLTVQNSLPSAAPAGRSVLVLGEAEEGVPGSELDLTKNFYTNFDDVLTFYKSGSIVDAARMLFSNQPSAVFSGTLNRLYVYKTNDSTRASKVVSAPSGYGTLFALKYGEGGNQIKTQIKTGQTEVKPTKTFNYLPSAASRTFSVVVNGVVTTGTAVAAHGLPAAFVTAMAATGLTITGGTARTTTTGALDVDVTASGDALTITKSAGVGFFDTASVQIGDSAYIQAGSSSIAGGSDQNAGSYLVQSVSASVLVLKQVKHSSTTAEINAVAFDTSLTSVALVAADLYVSAPVVMSVTGTTATGAAASLELLETTGANLSIAMLYRDADQSNMLINSTSSVASISATVPSAGKLTVSLNTGSFAIVPKAGDIVKIARGSLLAATAANVGLYIVESASAKTLTITRPFSGMTTTAVSSVVLNGANDTITTAPSFTTTAVAARRIDSASERKVKLEASQDSTNTTFPAVLIGGNPAIELSYFDGTTTAATVSIDSTRKMTLDFTGGGTDLTINTKKYANLKDLVAYLNSITGLSAKLSSPLFGSLPTSALDMVTSVGILGGSALPAYNGKIKKDYYDWKQTFVDNAVLVTFNDGSMSLKAGLPTAEATASFMTGATLGSTSNASIQAGLDSGLKVSVRHVVPLFSRDASFDINDGLTDEGSEYTIDSIHLATNGHVATASNSIRRKERYAMLSFDGSYEDSKEKCNTAAYERAQMFFQRVIAQGGDGTASLKLPYMAACAVAAGSSQAPTATSMLRKPFLLAGVSHSGLDSLFDESLIPDFDPEDYNQLNDAITNGLFVLREVQGFGIRAESPDLTTRSRTLDPKGWFYERKNVGMAADEVLDTCRNVLENFIGERTTDVPTAVVAKALSDVLDNFVNNRSIISYKILKVESLGNQYTASVQITMTEAIEAIILSVEAVRSVDA